MKAWNDLGENVRKDKQVFPVSQGRSCTFDVALANKVANTVLRTELSLFPLSLIFGGQRVRPCIR